MTLFREIIVPDQVLKQQASAFKINLLDFEVPSKDYALIWDSQTFWKINSLAF